MKFSRVNTDANDEINENNDDEKQNAESEPTENPVSVLEEKAEKLRLQSVAESETVSFEVSIRVSRFKEVSETVRSEVSIRVSHFQKVSQMMQFLEQNGIH